MILFLIGYNYVCIQCRKLDNLLNTILYLQGKILTGAHNIKETLNITQTLESTYICNHNKV